MGSIPILASSLSDVVLSSTANIWPAFERAFFLWCADATGFAEVLVGRTVFILTQAGASFTANVLGAKDAHSGCELVCVFQLIH